MKRLKDIRTDFEVLFMTGFTDDVIVHHGIDGSDVPVLRKPFRREALARKVRQILDGR